VEALADERRRLERELAEAKKKLAMGGGSQAADSGIAEIAGVKVMSRVLHGVEPKELRSIADEGKRQLGSGIAAIVAVAEDGKAAVAVGVTDDLTAASMRWSWCAPPRRRLAARAAAAGPTWPRPAVPTVPARRRRSRRSARRSQRGDGCRLSSSRQGHRPAGRRPRRP
jgi:alanyl-tRNA synthetase